MSKRWRDTMVPKCWRVKFQMWRRKRLDNCCSYNKTSLSLSLSLPLYLGTLPHCLSLWLSFSFSLTFSSSSLTLIVSLSLILCFSLRLPVSLFVPLSCGGNLLLTPWGPEAGGALTD